MKYLFAGLKVLALVCLFNVRRCRRASGNLDSNEDSATLTTACAMRIVR